MTQNLVVIRDIPPDPAIIVMLENLLERAKNGGVVSVGVAVEGRERTVMTYVGVNEHSNRFSLLGAIHHLAQRVQGLIEV